MDRMAQSGTDDDTLISAWLSALQAGGKAAEVASAIGGIFADMRRRERLFAQMEKFSDGEIIVAFLKENNVDIRFVSPIVEGEEGDLKTRALIRFQDKKITIFIEDSISDTEALVNFYHETQHLYQLGLGFQSLEKRVTAEEALFLAYVLEADAVVASIVTAFRQLGQTQDSAPLAFLADESYTYAPMTEAFLKKFRETENVTLAQRAAFDEYFTLEHVRAHYATTLVYRPDAGESAAMRVEIFSFIEKLGSLWSDGNYLALPGYETLADSHYWPTEEERALVKNPSAPDRVGIRGSVKAPSC